MVKIQSIILLMSLSMLLYGCGNSQALKQQNYVDINVQETSAYIAGDDPIAVQAAHNVAQARGNAADMMIAAAFTASVTSPARVSIGGGGLCIIMDHHLPAPVVIDFLPRANKNSGDIAIPSLLRGLLLIHRNFGRNDWRLLLGDAEKYADIGFPLSRFGDKDIKNYPYPASLQKIYGNKNAGDIIKQPVLSQLIRAIRLQPVAFYTSTLNRLMISDYQQYAVNFTRDDFNQVKPISKSAVIEQHETANTAYSDVHDQQPQLFGTSFITADISGQAVACFFTAGGAYGYGEISQHGGFLLAKDIGDQIVPKQIIQYHPNSKAVRAVLSLAGDNVDDALLRQILRININADGLLANNYPDFANINQNLRQFTAQYKAKDTTNHAGLQYLYCKPALSRDIERASRCQISNLFNPLGYATPVRQ